VQLLFLLDAVSYCSGILPKGLTCTVLSESKNNCPMLATCAVQMYTAHPKGWGWCYNSSCLFYTSCRCYWLLGEVSQ